MTIRSAKPKKPHLFTQIPEFDKAMRKLVKVPKRKVSERRSKTRGRGRGTKA
jgi:hypothetical protein